MAQGKYLTQKISIIILALLVLVSCQNSAETDKTPEITIKPSKDILPKIAQSYPVYENAFENLDYRPGFIINKVPDGGAGPEITGSLFTEDEPEKVFQWYMDEAGKQDWIRFEGGDSFMPYDPVEGFGVLSFHKKERTLSLQFRRKDGWKHTKIAYLGMRYSSEKVIK